MSDQTQLPELDSVGLLRYAWRQLTSMRTALILLLLVGIAAIPGSLVPQRTQNPLQVTQYFKDSPDLAQWMDRFYLFDVYGSPWFSAIYILLFISLIGCVLPRTFEHFKAARALPPATPKNLSRLEHHQAWSAQGNELELARAWFRSKRFRVLEVNGTISAEKGFMRETGNLFFHLALILILLGISFSSLFGMRGEAIVNVGERFVNTPTSYDTLTYGKLYRDSNVPAFMLTADKFVAQYNVETSAPEDYTLNVSLLREGSKTIEKKVIKVNKPMTIGTTRVYLQANGYAPVVTVRDSKGDVAFQGPVTFLPQDANLRSIGAIKVPDADPQIGFVASFFPTAERDEIRGGYSSFPELLDPRLLISVWQGDLKMDSGVPQSVYRIDTDGMERIGLKGLSIGESYDYGVGTITFNGVVPWVNLQVVKDPGKQAALIGSIFAIIGLLASLFIRQRRIYVRSNGKQIEIAGFGNRPGLEEEIKRMVEK